MLTNHFCQGPIIIGCADGKVRACHCKTNKAQTLYNTDSLVCSIGKEKIKFKFRQSMYL